MSFPKFRIPYTVESKELSLLTFVSGYGKSFPQAAIVTQGYCPVEGEEDTEEFSSGEENVAPAAAEKASCSVSVGLAAAKQHAVQACACVEGSQTCTGNQTCIGSQMLDAKLPYTHVPLRRIGVGLVVAQTLDWRVCRQTSACSSILPLTHTHTDVCPSQERSSLRV